MTGEGNSGGECGRKVALQLAVFCYRRVSSVGKDWGSERMTTAVTLCRISWCKTRDNSVDIATRLRAGRSGLQGAGNSSLHLRVQKGSGAHKTSYPMGTRGPFPGVKQPGSEADHTPSSNAEVKE
jgi:hypothetical protein